MQPNQECTYETKNFVLRAVLDSDTGSLKLSLEDLANGAAYERQYADQDIGNQICGKVELEDIFMAFKREPNDARKQ